MQVHDDPKVKIRLFSGAEFRQRFEVACAGGSALTIVSAYVTLPAIKWLSKLWKLDCRLLCRLKASDLYQGASDTEALKLAVNLGWQVFFDESIHSKIYLIDNGPLFIGSANLTANGIGLSRDSNSETMISLSPSPADLAYVLDLFDNAQCIDMQVILEMENFVDQFSPALSENKPTKWPEYIFPEKFVLKVSDFPLVGPGEICREYVLQPELTFAEIANWCKTPGEIEIALLQTKAYKWLMDTLLQEEQSQAWFGYLTSRLHNDLADDPAPYRRTVKELLANLLNFCECYLKSEIMLERPRQSQSVKYIGNLLKHKGLQDA